MGKTHACAALALAVPLRARRVGKPDESCGSSARDDADALHTSRPSPPAACLGTHAASGTAPGYLFVAEKDAKKAGGPLILDDRGRVVWFHQLAPPLEATDFRVQRYRGLPVRTWWVGHSSKVGVGRGSYVVYDTSYHQIAHVRAGLRRAGDLHEFQLTPRGTAYITVYDDILADLTEVGGPWRTVTSTTASSRRSTWRPAASSSSGTASVRCRSRSRRSQTASPRGRRPSSYDGRLPRELDRRGQSAGRFASPPATPVRSTSSRAAATSSGVSAASRTTSGRPPPSGSRSSTTPGSIPGTG